MTKRKEWIGWHFLPEDKCLRWGTREKVYSGKKYKVEGKLELCKFGLHASKKVLDALYWAPGPIVCRVKLSGEILEGKDKACATERTVIKMADATKVLHEFACWCAERALKKERKAGREPDKRSWNAIKVKRLWLKGKATKEESDAASDAAWSAAWSVASATWTAA